MASAMDHETASQKTSRRIMAIQRWLASKTMEVQRIGFYGELTATLKFEDGQCVYGEQHVTEKAK